MIKFYLLCNYDYNPGPALFVVNQNKYPTLWDPIEVDEKMVNFLLKNYKKTHYYKNIKTAKGVKNKYKKDFRFDIVIFLRKQDSGG